MILVTTPIRALSPFPRLEYKPQRWKSYTAGVTLSCPRTALGIHWGSPCSCGPVPPLPSGHLGLLLPQGLSTHCFPLNITPRFLHTSCLPACTVTWTQDQPGPSPPLSLANATSKITDEKLYGEEAFGWDLVGLPLFSQVGNPTGPPVSLAPL